MTLPDTQRSPCRPPTRSRPSSCSRGFGERSNVWRARDRGRTLSLPAASPSDPVGAGEASQYMTASQSPLRSPTEHARGHSRTVMPDRPTPRQRAWNSNPDASAAQLDHKPRPGRRLPASQTCCKVPPARSASVERPDFRPIREPEQLSALQTATSSTRFVEELRCRVSGWGVDAEDIHGETLFRLCTPTVGVQYDPALGTPIQFAIGIARMVRLEFSRRSAKTLMLAELADRASTCGEDPSDRAAGRESTAIVRDALRGLTEGDRRLVIDRFRLDGATESRPPLSSYERTRLRRALCSLRPRLAQPR